jgi:zinc D-Ala-D-Ala carboxypeptidase
VGDLSPHFTLSELTRTATGLPNTPTAEHLAALTAMCSTLIEPVRARFGPVSIHSGYRSTAVNEKIGGSVTSQHMRGEAADFHVPGVALETVFRWIVTESGLRFGQVILEGHTPAEPTWIHLSLGEPWRVGSACRQALTFDGARYSAWRG